MKKVIVGIRLCIKEENKNITVDTKNSVLLI